MESVAVLAVSGPWCTLHSCSALARSLEMSGHHMEALAFSLHLVIPWCPSWTRFRSSFHGEGGITMRHPRSKRPSSTVNSSVIGK